MDRTSPENRNVRGINQHEVTCYDSKKPEIDNISEYVQAKQEGNVTESQARNWQALAAVPMDVFESALSNPDTGWNPCRSYPPVNP